MRGPRAPRLLSLSSARRSVGRCPTAWPAAMGAVLPKLQASLGLSQDKAERRQQGAQGKRLAPRNSHTRFSGENSRRAARTDPDGFAKLSVTRQAPSCRILDVQGHRVTGTSSGVRRSRDPKISLHVTSGSRCLGRVDI